MVSDEKSVVNLIDDFFYMTNHFFLAAFSLSLTFDSLIILCLGVYIFEFNLLKFIEIFGYKDSYISLNIGGFQPLFLQLSFWDLLFSPSRTPTLCMLVD